MEKRRKMLTIHKQIGEIRILLLCLTLWVALVSAVLLISGNIMYLAGFLLGTAGSILYMYMLYRRVPTMLTMRPVVKGDIMAVLGGNAAGSANVVKLLLLGWIKTVQPIAALLLIILLISRFSHLVSFLAALFGFFSFQISLFFYTFLVSIYYLFR